MKQILNIVLLIMLAFLVSCELEPQVQISSNPGAPQISYPVDGQAFNYTWDNEKDSIKFIYSSANYGFTIIPTYTLIMDKAGNNFAKPVKLSTSKTDTIIYSVSKLNTALKRMKFAEGVPGEIELRVLSNISTNVADLVSNTIKISFSTYSQPAPPIDTTIVPIDTTTVPIDTTTVPIDTTSVPSDSLISPVIGNTIYLLGDATTAGWDNKTNLAFVWIKDEETFVTYAYLKANLEYKFLTNPGNWAPMWGTDANQTVEGGNLVCRETETVTDPPAIKSPAEAGYFKIVVDTINLVYETSPFNVGIVGTATPNGWEAPDIKMAYDNSTFFWTITTDLVAGKFKFRANDAWTWNLGGSFNKLTKDGSDIDIPEDGNYTIKLNLFSTPAKCTVTKN